MVETSESGNGKSLPETLESLAILAAANESKASALKMGGSYSLLRRFISPVDSIRDFRH